MRFAKHGLISAIMITLSVNKLIFLWVIKLYSSFHMGQILNKLKRLMFKLKVLRNFVLKWVFLFFMKITYATMESLQLQNLN